MKEITVSASSKYSIFIENGIIKKAGEYINALVHNCKALIVSDSTVFTLYGKALKDSLSSYPFETFEYIIAPGENSKSTANFCGILEYLCKNSFKKSDIIIAFGGGVCGDLAGFSSACYMRGIRYIQIPTTLLAAVDSSVGGKTAVNLEGGKNLAGAIYQPSLVLCDTSLFSTLDSRNIACGFSEIIKYGMICDKELFELLETCDAYTYPTDDITERCIRIKKRFVEADENDRSERKLLNFGHTLGHCIERHSGFSLSHGEAVSCGMVMISEIAERCGICESGVSERLSLLLRKYMLPTSYEISTSELFSLAEADKKVEGSLITLALPEKIGKCILKKADKKEFRRMLSLIKQKSSGDAL